MTLGSTTEELICVSEIPVMMIRRPIYRTTLQVRFNRILVAVDFSETSLKALNLAMRFSSFLGADFHVLHVADPTILRELQVRHPEVHLVSSSESEVREGVNGLLMQIAKTREDAPPVRGVTLFGDPVHQIIQYATDESCDFIVMGTRGRKPAERLFLGSNSRGVLSRIRIPLVTVSDLFRTQL